jgi:hypothetical protein
MTDSPRCREFRETAPELALGIASGDERARALEHLAGCTECRRRLEELSALSDELMLLAPEREPPVGFETRVAERLGPRTKRRRARVALAVAAAALVGAAAAAWTVFEATEEDRELAGAYRHTLETANGDYFGAWTLEAADGRRAGTVFAYQGSPPWVFMTLDAPGPGTFECEIEIESGGRMPLGKFPAARGSWGAVLPVQLHRVEAVLVHTPGGTELEARLGN